MKPRRIALVAWVLMGVLVKIFDVLTNIVANLLQDQLGAYAWLIVIPSYSIIFFVLVVFDRWDRLQALLQDHQLAYDRRNRQAMIYTVRTSVTKFLRDSLYHEVFITLHLTMRPKAVVPPRGVLEQRRDSPDQPLPPGTSIVDVFDTSARALLILGDSGAGKTMLLAKLSQSLLDRAAMDPDHPIPVFFRLSSWATHQRPLAAWLVDVLKEQYYIAHKTAQVWVDTNQILPLLDGLDEMALEYRAACITAINTFRQDGRGLLPLVVCSQIQDYEALGTPLRLQDAVVVQPLTRSQVEDYLAHVGQPSATVQKALQEDETLWELLNTPLMLYVMTQAYAEHPTAALLAKAPLEERRRHLLTVYVDQMFQRRSAILSYPRQQTEHWLTWLAWQMTQHNQTGFYLDQMQPDWLPQEQQRGPMLGAGLLAGMLWALGFALPAVQDFGLFGGLKTVLFSVVFFGLGTIVAFRFPSEIRTVEMVRWSWSTFRSQWSSPSIKFGLGIGALIGLNVGVGTGLLAGLLVGLGTVLVVAVLAGLSHGEVQTKTDPNEGIHRSSWRALSTGLCVRLLAAIFAELFKRLGIEHGAGGRSVQFYWLLIGLLVGVGVGLRFGGFACLQHIVLRLLLRHNRFAPLNYVKFLDYATERIFLHKVGGGYIFIHPLLQYYFAARYKE